MTNRTVFPVKLWFTLDIPSQRYYARDRFVLNLQIQTEESRGVVNRTGWRQGCVGDVSGGVSTHCRSAVSCLHQFAAAMKAKTERGKFCYLIYCEVIAKRKVTGT